MLRSRQALISVANKEGIADFAGALIALGWRITASPGTARALREAGHPVSDMTELTEIPAILSHRVFSEHIRIAGALVAEATPEHDRQRAEWDIPWFDLLCVDLYPLAQAIAEAGRESDVIEATDIGGVTLIRNAVKGRRIVLCRPDDRGLVLKQLQDRGDVDENTRRDLCARAERVCAEYCLESARYISGSRIDGVIGVRSVDLAYGENPYQTDAAFFESQPEDALSIGRFRQLAGKKPSYVNLASLNELLGVMARISAVMKAHDPGRTPYIAVGAKHGVPVGAAIDWDKPQAALAGMLWGDPKVIWGGEVIVNFPVDGELALCLLSDERRKEIFGGAAWMLDLVVAPAFDDRAVEILAGREKRRIFCNPALYAPSHFEAFAYKNVRGGFLRQPQADFTPVIPELVWTGEPLKDSELDSLLLAWAIAYSLHANGIALALNRRLIGCDGQPSSVGAVQTALGKAQTADHGTEGAVFAANAFLPFADAALLLADHRLRGGILPRGGVNEAAVQKVFAERKMNIAWVPEPYRGFARH